MHQAQLRARILAETRTVPPPVCITLPSPCCWDRKDPGLVSPYHSLAKLSPVAGIGIVTLAPGRVRQEDESSR